MSTDNEIISTHEYDKSHPVYIKIKKEFAKRLKAKYNCEDFDKIVDYVMDFAFRKKATKSECISNMNSLFNGKADVMMDYLWKITKDIENSSNDSDYSENRGKKFNKYRNIRERSRSRSYERSKNKFNISKYQANMVQRGFYPPKMRYGAQMMPMTIPYSRSIAPYIMMNPAMMKKPKKLFPSQKPFSKKDSKEKEKSGEQKEGQEKQELTEEQNKKILEKEAFEKMTPEQQKEVLAKRVPTKKIRCKNWPNCNDPTCIYSHPTETCPYFPSCTFGDNCCYIHPSIPCKYGYYCTRIGCAYSHPQGSNPGMAMYPNMMNSIPFKKHKSKKPANNNDKPQADNNANDEKPKIEEKNSENKEEIKPEGNVEQKEENQIMNEGN